MLKPRAHNQHEANCDPAAFGRLCVETVKSSNSIEILVQPPSGGCVLKPFVYGVMSKRLSQPPSGGCVLKHVGRREILFVEVQPLSGGCVLKQSKAFSGTRSSKPAG